MSNNEFLQDADMKIIAAASGAKGKAFEALNAAKEKNYELAETLIKEAEEYFRESHSAHFELLQLDAKDELGALDILTTHSQDHFMAALVSIDLIKEMIEMYKQFSR